METRANYVLIGAFALAGILGSFAFLLWIAKVDVDRQYSYYDVLFDNVQGLATAGDVRYNGLPVGQVVGMALDETDNTKVRVTLELRATTPITETTVAQLQSLGVTGVGYVSLSSGAPGAAPVPSGGTIPSQRSTLQTIFEGAPKLMDEAVALLEDIRSVVDDQNRDAVSDVLANLATASARMDAVLADFEGLSDDLGGAAREIAAFTGRLDSLSATAETTLTTATDTLSKAGVAADSAVGALDTARETFDTANTLIQTDLSEFVRRGSSAAITLDETLTALEPPVLATLQAAQEMAETRLPQLVAELQQTAAAIETQVNTVGGDASDLINRYEAVGRTVQDRAEQAEKALADFEEATVQATATLASIEATSDSARAFLETEGTPLAQEATATLARVQDLTDNRLAPTLDSARAALDTVDREAQALSAEGRKLMTAATDRLEQAKGTLTQLDTTLTAASDTMDAVTLTADTVTTLIEADGKALIADARAATEEARAAISTINASVQKDLPGILEDIRNATSTANRVIDTVGQDVSGVTTRLAALADDGSATLAAASQTFAEANTTLDAIYSAMASAEDTLGAAEQTFTSVNTILDEDVDQMISDMRGAVTAFTTTIEGVSGDVDAISSEVLSASQSAAELMATVDGVVQENRRQLSDFMRVGLPQFQYFLAESRRLVVNLERLVDRIERDPARFLLGTQASDYRR